MQHQFCQALEQIQTQQEVSVDLVARQVEVKARDQCDEELSLAVFEDFFVALHLLAVLEQVIDAREN